MSLTFKSGQVPMKTPRPINETAPPQKITRWQSSTTPLSSLSKRVGEAAPPSRTHSHRKEDEEREKTSSTQKEEGWREQHHSEEDGEGSTTHKGTSKKEASTTTTQEEGIATSRTSSDDKRLQPRSFCHFLHSMHRSIWELSLRNLDHHILDLLQRRK